jgi:hypothetical protein
MIRCPKAWAIRIQTPTTNLAISMRKEYKIPPHIALQVQKRDRERNAGEEQRRHYKYLDVMKRAFECLREFEWMLVITCFFAVLVV